MTNTITRQYIQNGSREIVINFAVQGDGTSGDLAAVLLPITTGDLNGTAGYCSMLEINQAGGQQSCTAQLLWKATTNVLFMDLPTQGATTYCFESEGGIPNPKAAGYNGDILVSTQGLNGGGAGSPGSYTFTCRLRKK